MNIDLKIQELRNELNRDYAIKTDRDMFIKLGISDEHNKKMVFKWIEYQSAFSFRDGQESIEPKQITSTPFGFYKSPFNLEYIGLDEITSISRLTELQSPTNTYGELSFGFYITLKSEQILLTRKPYSDEVTKTTITMCDNKTYPIDEYVKLEYPANETKYYENINREREQLIEAWLNFKNR